MSTCVRKDSPDDWAMTCANPSFRRSYGWSELRVLPTRAKGEDAECVSRNLAAEVKRRGLDPRPLVIP